MVAKEVMVKGQLTGNDFCQFHRDLQGHEMGLRVELSTKSRCFSELAFARHLVNNRPLQQKRGVKII